MGKIDQINGKLESMADGDNVVYLNINDAFLNDNGALPVTVMPDLLHPNATGYALWCSAMKPTLETMIEGTK